MFESLSLAWVWVIVGAILVGLELVVPGVFLLWIGFGALLVGLILVLIPDLAPGWQALVFAVCMLASIGTGFVIQRRSPVRRAEGELNQEMNGFIGQVYTAVVDFEAGRGRLRVGDTTYAGESEHPVHRNQRVRVAAIHGQRLVVVPVDDGPP